VAIFEECFEEVGVGGEVESVRYLVAECDCHPQLEAEILASVRGGVVEELLMERKVLSVDAHEAGDACGLRRRYETNTVGFVAESRLGKAAAVVEEIVDEVER